MALSKNQMIYIGGFAIIGIMVVGTLAFVPGAFEGSDGQGGGVAEDAGYVPWLNDLFTIIVYGTTDPASLPLDEEGNPVGYELPGEMESMLFAVQAAIGAIIIGFFIGMTYAKKKAEGAE